jgi:ABC-type transport system involved in cytochrome bd biosynthesis fused ATPase/permease subunit
VGRKHFLACTRWLWQVVEDVNILHGVFLLYAIPIVIGFVVICAAFIALAVSDPGFAELLLFTAILGLIIGLPEALGR